MKTYKKYKLRPCKKYDLMEVYNRLCNSFHHLKNDYDRIIYPLFNNEYILAYNDGYYCQSKEHMSSGVPFMFGNEFLYELKDNKDASI